MPMRLRILLSCTLLAGLAGCTYVQTQQSLDLYLKGQLQAERGDLNAALGTLAAAIKENPRMGVAYMARGKILKDQGNFEEAAKEFEHAVAVEPNNFRANFELGTIYQRLKRFGEAVTALSNALKIRPLDPEANMDLALAYAQNGDPISGLYNAQVAVQNDPDNPATRASLGYLYAQVGDDTNAITQYKRSIELNSKQPEVYANLAQVYIHSGNFQQARNVLETARALSPSPLVFDRLGAACYKLQEYDQARANFNEALKLDPKYYSSLNGLGVVAMSQALVTSPPNVNLAKEAVAYWPKSLDINKAQPAISRLVAEYTPKSASQ